MTTIVILDRLLFFQLFRFHPFRIPFEIDTHPYIIVSKLLLANNLDHVALEIVLLLHQFLILTIFELTDLTIILNLPKIIDQPAFLSKMDICLPTLIIIRSISTIRFDVLIAKPRVSVRIFDSMINQLTSLSFDKHLRFATFINIMLHTLLFIRLPT